MFSSNIQNLLNTSGADSALQRAAKLEEMLQIQTQSVRSIEPPKRADGKTFTDFLKVEPPTDLKFKLSEPLTSSRAEINDIIKEASDRFGVDSRLISALIKQESGFNPKAVSKVGAVGLMQLMPSTAQHLGVMDPFNAKQNIHGGTKYLKSLIDKFNGNIVLALAAYNAGPNAVSKYNGIPPYKETQNYVKSILKNFLS